MKSKKKLALYLVLFLSSVLVCSYLGAVALFKYSHSRPVDYEVEDFK